MQKKICLSIEQMQKLKDLGVDTKDASLVRIPYDEDGIEIAPSLFNKEETAWWDDENECWVTSFYMELHDAETGNYDYSHREEYATFTLQDMLCMMPELYPIDVMGLTVLDTDGVHSDSNEIYSPTLYLYDGKWVCGYISSYDSEAWVEFLANNPLDAAFDMLVWLAENGYLKKEARN